MDKDYSRDKEFERSRDIYVPVWVQTLIDLYTSGLRDDGNDKFV